MDFASPGISIQATPGTTPMGGSDDAKQSHEMRILVHAPTRNDGRLTAQFLAKAGMQPLVCPDMATLCKCLKEGCGAAILAEESLNSESLKRLVTTLEMQPSWSDLPLIIITGTGESLIRRRHLTALGPVGNVSIIERPVRPDTLVSALESAMRSRLRQYQVRSLLTELEGMTAKAMEADRRKDEFLAMLAHELRNPLASVANAATILKSDPDKDSYQWAAGVIDRQTRQLSHLIDDLLDVSRITTGKIRLRREVVDGAIILERACESAGPIVAERGHRLHSDFPKGELWLEADPTRIEQILLNLLTNAAKYTPSGGDIWLTGHRLDGEVIISVRDNGMGISPKRLPEMFELFAQGERSIARSEGGLGIGLTIVRKLAEMHGGSVEAHSAGANQGSTFTVRLPQVSRPARSRGEAPAAVETKGDAIRVLVVDDNVDTARGLAKLLTRAGHEIIMAHDGPQALAQAREQTPQAIVLDIGLPGMDGFEVARKLRKDASSRDTLIIAVTGYGQDEDRQRAMDAGFDHHLVKPVDLKRLKMLLSEEASKAGVRGELA